MAFLIPATSLAIVRRGEIVTAHGTPQVTVTIDGDARDLMRRLAQWRGKPEDADGQPA